MDLIVKDGVEPEHTVIVPFSRLWCVNPFFDSLEENDLPSNTDLICYVDTSEEALYEAVCRRSKMLADKLVGLRVLWGKNGIHDNDSVPDCRIRIQNIHERLKEYIRGRIVIGLEDDTLVPKDGIIKLANHLYEPNVGFAQGVEVGRRGYRVFGVWVTNSEMTQIGTPKRMKGVMGVQGGGFYCFAVRANLYKEHQFDQSKSEWGFLGPDFNFSNSLWRKGWTVLTDWTIPCVHMQEDGKDLTVDDYKHTVVYAKDGDHWSSHLTVV